jgi:LacI family transcriptional regulator
VPPLHDLGLAHSVALVDFDDVVLGDVVEHGLTVLARDTAGLGRAAAELLFSRLDGAGGPTRQIVLASTLIARGSGELAGPDGSAAGASRRRHGSTS